MRHITLTQGQFATVDDEDYERIAAFRWYACYTANSHSFRAARSGGASNKKLILMHREIMCAQPDEFIDHRNHDTLDNRRCNLRKCSIAENNRNAQKRADNTSGFKGVSWCKHCKKWKAQISFNSQHLYLGIYSSAVEAARAYDEAALRLHGEFSLSNNIDPRLP